MQVKTPVKTVDSLDFARSPEVLHGAVAIASLKRLQDMLAGPEGTLDFELSGARDGVGRLALRLKLKGDVQLSCRRCLEAVPHWLQAETLLLLAKNEQELERFSADDEGPEAILAEPRLDVLALVEDEAILALPYAPVHQTGNCAAAGESEEKEGRPNPFAKLAALKKH